MLTLDKNHKYIVAIFSDETGRTPAGAAFDWKGGKTHAAARAALSPYGEEIPVPLFAVAIPLSAWRDKWEAIFHNTSSSNHCKEGYCYKMMASLRHHLDTLYDTFDVIWEGVSTDIAYYTDADGKRVLNHGYGGEVVTVGAPNHSREVFDGLIRRTFGWSERECRAQVKYMGAWFYATTAPDGHCSRGARGGYVSANSTDINELLNA